MARFSDADRDARIEEILVDTYGPDEEAASWEVAFQDGVATPFSATLLGASVTVTAFRANSRGVQCRVNRDGRERWIGVGDLDEPGLPDDMLDLLELYDHWGGND